jgi:hypothetical protein
MATQTTSQIAAASSESSRQSSRLNNAVDDYRHDVELGLPNNNSITLDEHSDDRILDNNTVIVTPEDHLAAVGGNESTGTAAETGRGLDHCTQVTVAEA